MHKLQAYPGWQQWKRSQIGYALNFDDEFMPRERQVEEFKFSPEMESEHAVLSSYLELLSTANALRDVEWYFRRYPFSRAPVTQESHLRYCCEMYFSRFYQFRERLKVLSKEVKSAVPDHGLDFGKLIKTFDKEFDQEIRARHGVHHHEAFDDVAIYRIALLELTDPSDGRELSKRAYQSHYRKTANEWASRTRRRSETLDAFVEAVADALLRTCPFLSVAKS
ncbi:hypothetical protein [Tritonibacter sp. SIMBA_163]|uniref:hypothetical protein n=1 Tax=Tritonibacter sp. SIMBA_163 TaxID=3080868 RepID=UPI00397F6FCE